MVYIYKKIIGGKPYYYLRASERKGSRVIVKDIAYLGNTIEDVKRAIASSKHKEKIKKTYKTIHNFLESNHYLEKIRSLKLKKDPLLGDKLEEIEACKLHFNSVFNSLDSQTKKEIINNFIIEFAFNTTSIEGNTIKLKEARDLLQEGLTPKNKTLREIYDIQNTEKVFLEIFNLKDKLSHELIIKIHSSLMDNIDSRKGYRNSDVHVVKANFKATPAPYVKTDIELLLKWYNEMKNKVHPITLASVFHHKFEKIHPFMDGNGRTGRILLIHILQLNNYPPVIIRKKFRAEYLESLRKADKSNLTEFNKERYNSIVQFLAKEFIEEYWNLFL